MKITKIEKQKKNSERYSLYVDDEFWMGVNEAVLVKFALFKAQTVTAKDLNEIAEAEYQHSIYSQAIKFLAHGLKTVKETRDYLTKYLADRHKEQEEQPHPNEALYIEPHVWRTSFEHSHDAVLLVLSSLEYNEEDYIRDYDKFLKLVRK